MGQLVCCTTNGPDDEPGLQVTLETKAGHAVTTATMTEIKSTLLLDATHLTGETVVWDTRYGRSVDGIHVQWHPALRAKVAVGAANIKSFARASLDTAVLLLRQREPLHDTTWSWLDKMIVTALKYCDSEALLVAWSLSTKLDRDGMWELRTFQDHPQPFLYFDQVRLLVLLHDVDDMVNFSIELQDKQLTQ
ncbi:Aste57867_13268 [Aphanomyces stellatus]|uniref:Aste57867_13268 protein n=1 Tax=Aphanomyces stellatus TaxID=120398 RepID=A0A485KYD7_9STRA|nr:hypothetical protein As57867_013219 [Aphanomyces stellatus]VFT90108.1 Aste57867_13268 [Aphanomyces stellatus]